MSEEYTPQPEPTQTVYITETAPPNLVKGAIGALLGSLFGAAFASEPKMEVGATPPLAWGPWSALGRVSSLGVKARCWE